MEAPKSFKGWSESLPSFFAHDLLLFPEATPDQARCIKEGLDGFCKASAQRVSFNKSLLFVSPNSDQQATGELSNNPGFPLVLELGRCLGHQLIHKGRSSSQWGALMQRVMGKLEGWKSNCLSRAGRLTLVKSVLSNMAIFHMKLQKLSTKIHKDLDRAVRQYIWRSSPTRWQIHLLSWDTLYRSKERGGGGLRKSEDMNKSLLAKLGWRILTCGEKTWCRVIRDKYGIFDDRPLTLKHKLRESHV